MEGEVLFKMPAWVAQPFGGLVSWPSKVSWLIHCFFNSFEIKSNEPTT